MFPQCQKSFPFPPNWLVFAEILPFHFCSNFERFARRIIVRRLRKCPLTAALREAPPSHYVYCGIVVGEMAAVLVGWPVVARGIWGQLDGVSGDASCAICSGGTWRPPALPPGIDNTNSCVVELMLQ